MYKKRKNVIIATKKYFINRVFFANPPFFCKKISTGLGSAAQILLRLWGGGFSRIENPLNPQKVEGSTFYKVKGFVFKSHFVGCFDDFEKKKVLLEVVDFFIFTII
jgi:hypothetical protein